MKPSTSRKLLLCATAILCACAGIGGGYLLQTSNTDPSPEATIPTSSAASAASATGIVIGPGYMPVANASNARIASAEITNATSAFPLDQNGKLLVDDKTETVLDRFLAMLPADATEAQRTALDVKVRAGLSGETAARAVQLMHAYIDYRQAYGQLAEPEDPQDVAQQRQAADVRIALRRKYFDRDTADALFGMREAQQIYSLEVARIAKDNSLSPDAKAQSIKSLHAALPPKVAAVEFNRPEDFSAEVEERVALLRLRGAPNEEISHARKQYFGIEESAANRPDGNNVRPAPDAGAPANN